MVVKNSQNGFTIIEVIVTMIITTVFLVAFVQAYLVLESQRLLVGQRAKAGDIAYTNLRKFTVRPSASILPCTSDMDLSSSNATPYKKDADNPLSGKVYKPGVKLGDQTNNPGASAYGFIAEDVSGTNSLGRNVIQEVRAYAPKGCGSDYASSPLRIISTVTYGNGETVIHAALIN